MFKMSGVRVPLLVIVLGLLAGGAALADGVTGIGFGFDRFLSDVSMAYDGGTVSLFVVPDGGGRELTRAFDQFGNEVDATISVTLIDNMGQPVPDYPVEDMWLESSDSELNLCLQGSWADEPTDAAGQTSWTAPLLGGGSSQAGCLVMINGEPLSFTPLNLRFNSADINGDLQVGLVDVTLFAGDFYGNYQYRSDFNFDGILDLIDVVFLADAMGRSCP